MLSVKKSLPLPLALPIELLDKVYSFDPTHRENYKKVMEDITLYKKAAAYVYEIKQWYDIGASKWYWFLPFNAIKTIVIKQRYCCELCARDNFISKMKDIPKN